MSLQAACQIILSMTSVAFVILLGLFFDVIFLKNCLLWKSLFHLIWQQLTILTKSKYDGFFILIGGPIFHCRAQFLRSLWFRVWLVACTSTLKVNSCMSTSLMMLILVVALSVVFTNAADGAVQW